MKKIAVLSASSSRTELHPALLDHSLLHSADVILVSGISSKDVDDPRTTINPPPAYERQINKVLSHIAGTLGARHNVILPIEITSGLVYDLIWMIHSHLRSLGMELGPESHQIPMYMISPVAEQSLQYANICGEWMTPEYQEQLWRPNVPLPHGELMKSRALTTFTTMAAIPLSKTKDLRSSPCLVFTGDHQVLSHGALDWFIQNWGTDANNLCLFTGKTSRHAHIIPLMNLTFSLSLQMQAFHKINCTSTIKWI
jgi:integrator complex subunit 9